MFIKPIKVSCKLCKLQCPALFHRYLQNIDGASGKFYRVSDAASVTVTANQIGAKNVGYFSITNNDNSYAYNYRADAEL